MKVFFAGYSDADLPGVLPVIEVLRRQGKWLPVLVPGTYFKDGSGLLSASPPSGLEIAPLRLEAERQRKAERRGRDLLREARSRAERPTSRQGASGRGLRSFFRRPEMAALFSAYAAIEMAAVEMAVNERPAAVVLPEDTDYLRGRLLARVFRRHGAQVVCLVPWYYSSFVSYPLIGERYAHSYLVGTRSFGRRLQDAGVERRRVHVVGHPVFDAVDGTPPPPPGRFLFALQGLPWEDRIVGDLLGIFAGKPAASLLLKRHPQLASPGWLKRLSLPANVRLTARDEPLAELLEDTGCVIAQTSRMLFEAALRGREVLVPHYEATPMRIDIASSPRHAVVARSAQELARKVEGVLAGRGHSLSRAVFAPYHPRATERVVEVLNRLLASAAANRRDQDPVT